MSLTTTAELIAQARESRSAVFAFNIITLEHAEGIAAGAAAAGRACILQLSQNTVAFHHDNPAPLAAAAVAIAEAATVPLAVHLDHITDPALALRAAELGIGSVMFDAGALPYAENVRSTGEVTAALHRHGVFVEAELGYVGGKPDAPVSAHAAGVRTDPQEAAAFVRDTGVDALAVAVGSSHAMTTKSAALDHALIDALAAATRVPLVLHGSSGVPDDELRSAITAGMTKINVGTALNIAFDRAVRDALSQTDSVDPRRYLRPAREAVAAEVQRLLEL